MPLRPSPPGPFFENFAVTGKFFPVFLDKYRWEEGEMEKRRTVKAGTDGLSPHTKARESLDPPPALLTRWTLQGPHLSPARPQTPAAPVEETSCRHANPKLPSRLPSPHARPLDKRFNRPPAPLPSTRSNVWPPSLGPRVRPPPAHARLRVSRRQDTPRGARRPPSQMFSFVALNKDETLRKGEPPRFVKTSLDPYQSRSTYDQPITFVTKEEGTAKNEK